MKRCFRSKECFWQVGELGAHPPAPFPLHNTLWKGKFGFSPCARNRVVSFWRRSLSPKPIPPPPLVKMKRFTLDGKQGKRDLLKSTQRLRAHELQGYVSLPLEKHVLQCKEGQVHFTIRVMLKWNLDFWGCTLDNTRVVMLVAILSCPLAWLDEGSTCKTAITANIISVLSACFFLLPPQNCLSNYSTHTALHRGGQPVNWTEGGGGIFKKWNTTETALGCYGRHPSYNRIRGHQVCPFPSHLLPNSAPSISILKTQLELENKYCWSPCKVGELEILVSPIPPLDTFS